MMEQQCVLDKKGSSRSIPDARRLGKLFYALVIGVLGGALIGMPYDRLFGFPQLWSTALQFSISTVTFASLLSTWPTKLAIEQGCFRQVPKN